MLKYAKPVLSRKVWVKLFVTLFPVTFSYAKLWLYFVDFCLPTLGKTNGSLLSLSHIQKYYFMWHEYRLFRVNTVGN